MLVYEAEVKKIQKVKTHSRVCHFMVDAGAPVLFTTEG